MLQIYIWYLISGEKQDYNFIAKSSKIIFIWLMARTNNFMADKLCYYYTFFFPFSESLFCVKKFTALTIELHPTFLDLGTSLRDITNISGQILVVCHFCDSVKQSNHLSLEREIIFLLCYRRITLILDFWVWFVPTVAGLLFLVHLCAIWFISTTQVSILI